MTRLTAHKYEKDLFRDIYCKLEELEDMFELMEEMYNKPVYWKCVDGEIYYDIYDDSTILYNPKTNEIEIYRYEFIASFKLEEYGSSWWLSKRNEKRV